MMVREGVAGAGTAGRLPSSVLAAGDPHEDATAAEAAQAETAQSESSQVSTGTSPSPKTSVLP